MPNLTTNYDFYLPLVNNATDQDLWGGYLNDNWTSLDSLLLVATDIITLSKTATYSVVVGDRNKLVLCNATTGAITINLPAAATAGDGFTIYVKKTDASANAVTLDGSASQTIDGSTTYALSARYNFVAIVCDGSNWHVISTQRTASATQAGIVELATAAETLTGTDDTRAITPDGFAGNKSLAADGYYKLPGGLILQWGSQAATFNGSFTTITFPTAFSSACYSVATQISMAAVVSGSIGTVVKSITTTNFQFAGDQSSDSGTGTVYYQAVGR